MARLFSCCASVLDIVSDARTCRLYRSSSVPPLSRVMNWNFRIAVNSFYLIGILCINGVKFKPFFCLCEIVAVRACMCHLRGGRIQCNLLSACYAVPSRQCAHIIPNDYTSVSSAFVSAILNRILHPSSWSSSSVYAALHTYLPQPKRTPIHNLPWSICNRLYNTPFSLFNSINKNKRHLSKSASLSPPLPVSAFDYLQAVARILNYNPPFIHMQ